ncbi:pyridoxamine 5-phosphate oxidase [Paracoccus sp. S3-43]|uniref:HugZ family pyridoxamine 5'-phosphate oxidase n=1 Tax=Paracoccus sp. S3-43 TaxID=3030011 RepID=UPI0023AFC4A3|nr:pyridoxamine 5-phosphate oxidase [Paracoccus sp. S3-43]WEF25292.1 pyridoxamine 5-phosphate oxidase [Paracoccus sp. S3-43]
MTKDPIRRTTDDARDKARRTLAAMRHAVLAVNDAATGHPHLSRIACQIDPSGAPVALLSGLAVHSRALAADPRAALLVETPGDKGDPMTRPRLSLQVTALVIDDTAGLRDRWLDAHPKAAAFIDLPDFRFWRLAPQSGFLNAGFGAAFRLRPADLGIA